MKIKLVVVLIVSSLVVFSSCTQYKYEEFGDDLAEVFGNDKYEDFDTTAYYAVFKNELKVQKKLIHNPIWLSTIYESENYGLTLIGDFLVNGEIDTLNTYLNESVYHGLNPNYFHADKIADLIKQVKETKFKKVEEIYPLLAALEIFCADGLINYSNILKYGAINPKEIYGSYYIKVARPDLINSQKSLDQLNLVEFLQEIQPQNKDYKRFQNLLISKKEITSAQREKIYLNMERLRWLTKEYPDRFLLVNIPEFKLRLIEDNKSILDMNVCVGETDYKPFSRKQQNHETPILSGVINRMQVNPVWHIPKSIAGKEILEALIKDSTYLETNNMVAFDKDKNLVNASTIDWETVNINDYSFKQNPGADNSLGRIKFIFNNPYAIYLHDTPAKAMFKEKNRAVSHGCVRVEEPIKLAEFLLKDEQEVERIKEEMAARDSIKSRWVSVKKPVPVFMVYYTVLLSDKGEITTINDVYGYDVKLKAVFDKFSANNKPLKL